MSDISELHMRKLKSFFYRRDMDKNGVLDLEDIVKEKMRIAKRYNVTIDEKKFRENHFKSFKELGMKSSMNFEEVVHMVMKNMEKHSTNPQAVQERVRSLSADIFQAIDVNNDGKLSAEEYKMWFDSVVSCGGTDEGAWERPFRVLDADNDGYVDLEELAVGITRYLYVDEESDYQHVMGPLITDEEWNAAYGK